MAIANRSPFHAVSAEHINALADAVDDALGKLFNEQSPLLYLPYTGGGSWQAAKLGGLLFRFGSGTPRILSGVTEHTQSTYDTLAASATILDSDHTLKQVTLDVTSTAFDRSLKIQTREVTPPMGDPEPYWVRAQALSADSVWYYYVEHRHELAVADLVWEGHAGRTYTVPATWDKFQCLRLHNLDPDEDPLAVTLEGSTTDLVIDLERWQCVTVRRNAEGDWEQQGFLLWRATQADVARFGGTLAWNDRVNRIDGQPHANLREADGANNIGCTAALARWIDWFSPSQSDLHGIVLSSLGGGLADAHRARTGIWYDLAQVVPKARVPGMASGADPDAPLWGFQLHGGLFMVVRKYDSITDPVIEHHTLSASQLTAANASGLIVTVQSASTLRVTLDPESELNDDLEWIDILPIGATMLGAGLYRITAPDTYADISLPSTPQPSIFVRAWTLTTQTENVTGLVTNRSRAYDLLSFGFEGGSPPPFPSAPTLSDATGWEFDDETVNNTHWTRTENQAGWDGRVLAVQVGATLSPAPGAIFPTFGLSGLMSGYSLLAEDDRIYWSQLHQVSTWPEEGGIWHTLQYPRVGQYPADPDLHHPHILNPYGAGGTDWTASPNHDKPATRVYRHEAAPEPVAYLWGPVRHLAEDSLAWIASNLDAIDATWWAANRATLASGDELPDEIRPITAVPLLAIHYNAMACRLNAISEIVPFSFLDARWYGVPFRPPTGRDGIYGGHIYPWGFLCRAAGTASTRATDLGITIRDLDTTHPELGDLEAYGPILGVSSGGSTYTAFTTHNLLNDLYHWFLPDDEIDYGETTAIAASAPSGSWTVGSGVPPEPYGNYWYQIDNTEAVVPEMDYLLAVDVAAAATDLGIPFALERLCLPLKATVFTPTDNGIEAQRVRVPVGTGSALGRRTQAMLTIDRGETPRFAAFAGGSGDWLWAPGGLVRVADWSPYPETAGANIGSDDPDVIEMTSSLGQGLNRSAFWGSGIPWGYLWALYVATNPSHLGGAADDTRWINGSVFAGEAPLVRFESHRSSVIPPARLMALPVPAVQWGDTDLETHAAPDVPFGCAEEPTSRTITAGGLWTAGGGAGDLEGGGFQVGLIHGGHRG